MEREAGLHQRQPETKESSNGTQPPPSDPAPSSSSLAPAPPSVTPSPPRLTPNPLLLDGPSPSSSSSSVATPITCSPPPPLTPAPSLSASSAHVTKSATPTSPHLLVPAPPKLTSTAAPALRTYGRPILPSPAKTAPVSSSGATNAPTTATTTTLQKCTTTTTAPPSTATTKTNSSTASAAASTSSSLAPKTSSALTNGSARTVATTTSTPITPFHTPASPPGRQVSQSLPVGSAALARANQSAAPVRPRVSQQTLLLGKGLKGPGQDQVLLRAQMLQSLTLRPPPPGALTIPPSLRLKPPSSAPGSSAPPPPLSRPQTSLFPPLRPRPVTTATTNNSVTTTTTPSRHLSVPPPTLYSPVRAVPLRPRLLSPNGHRSPAPKQPLHSIASTATAAPPPPPPPIPPSTSSPSSSSPSVVNRSLSGLKTSCPLAPTVLSPGQPPPVPPPCFERSPSAARQLQIIALSSGRQLQTQPQKTSPENKNVLSPTLAKRSSPLPSPTAPKMDTKEKLQQDKKPSEAKDLKVGVVDQREREKTKIPIEKEDNIAAKKPRIDESDSSDALNVTEQRAPSVKKQEEEKKTVELETQDQAKKEAKDCKNETKPRITESRALKLSPNASLKPSPPAVSPAGPVRTQITTAAPAATGGPTLSPPVPPAAPVSSPLPAPEATAANHSHPSRFSELHSTNQDDNVSVQSDNQSALSSLSSQSPPCSPFVSPAVDPAPAPPQPPDRPTDLRLNHKPDQTPNGSSLNHHEPHAEPETLHQSEEEETEGFDQSERCPWEPRAWPEGQQVLTHLVEGFVIQEGLTPFPVNRSSLLVPDQVTKPQEVNGTNGSAESPVATETRKPTEHSTDTEDEEGAETNDRNTRPPHRDRAVLHCQFCGKRGHAHNFMRSKRFCSTSCARGFNVRLTKRLRALSAGSRSDRPRPVLNRAESVPGKPLLLRLPRDLWSAGRREKEVKEKPPPAAAVEEEEDDMEVEAGAEEDDGDDGPEEEEDDEEEEEEEEEEDEEEEEPAAMTTSPHSNNGLTHNNNNTTSVSHNNNNNSSNSISNNSSSGGGVLTQAEGAVPQRVQRRASAPAVTSTFRPSPSQWSVEEVTAFINALPGCGDVAEAFRSQEIDGQALLLLTEDHLMTSLNIKLGPALKICAHINSLKNQ